LLVIPVEIAQFGWLMLDTTDIQKRDATDKYGENL